MEDVIAIKVVARSNKSSYLLTWGRIFDNIDSKELLDVVKRYLEKHTKNKFKSIRLCESLQEASGEPYFYETLFTMAQKKIPFGKSYLAWRRRTAKSLRAGKEIYFLG